MSKRNMAALLPLASLLLALAPALAGRDADAHARQHNDAAHKSQRAKPARKAATPYACPMHPDVVSAKPGRCPECGMFLKAAEEKPANATTKGHWVRSKTAIFRRRCEPLVSSLLAEGST